MSDPIIVTDWELLKLALAEGVPCKIAGFDGDFRFLSNFFPAPVEVDRITFPTVEHAYQAAKTPNRGERQAIAALPGPGQAKRAGSKIRVDADWEAARLAVMGHLVRLKFTTHADLGEKLLATGACYLEETNTWGDRFWGVCGGTGANHLGRILMEVRESLRTGESACGRAGSAGPGPC